MATDAVVQGTNPNDVELPLQTIGQAKRAPMPGDD